jgi:hypothetical protein
MLHLKYCSRLKFSFSSYIHLKTTSREAAFHATLASAAEPHLGYDRGGERDSILAGDATENRKVSERDHISQRQSDHRLHHARGAILLGKIRVDSGSPGLQTQTRFLEKLRRRVWHGRALWDGGSERLGSSASTRLEPDTATVAAIQSNGDGTPQFVKPRLGQGIFRALLTDSSCTISGERTLPVLEAAHIKRFL